MINFHIFFFRELFKQNGSAVDVTIATMFCNGVTTMQSMGIGGGFIMNIYKQDERKAYTLDAKDIAPMNANESLYKDNSETSMFGGLSIAVPGELRGYWEAHKRFGNLPWKTILEPVIRICEDGIIMTKHMADAITFAPKIKDDKNLRAFLVNSTTGEFHKQGSLIKPEKICDTLSIIAENGGDDFYNGSMASFILDDLADAGSIITREDLEQYQPIWADSLPLKINDHTLHLTPFTSGGIFVGYIMNILRGYNITVNDLRSTESETLLYHRIIEAFKFTFAKRMNFGDPNFVNVTQVCVSLSFFCPLRFSQ